MWSGGGGPHAVFIIGQSCLSLNTDLNILSLNANKKLHFLLRCLAVRQNVSHLPGFNVGTNSGIYSFRQRLRNDLQKLCAKGK